LKAKKSYGQHFLNSELITEEIANSLEAKDYKKVLEIGPGKGMLTKYLLKKDFDIPADFLKLDLKPFFGDESFGLIGNFPYNISSQILFKMLEYKSQIPEMVGMFQKEVAERVVAGPGSKTYGVISVLIQAFYEGKYLFTVDKSNFTPPPKVQSGVIRLTRKDNLDLGCDPKLFSQIVKQTFGQRRKMLRNTMKSFLKGSPLLEETFFTKRPEKISVEEFVQLTKWVEAHQSKTD